MKKPLLKRDGLRSGALSLAAIDTAVTKAVASEQILDIHTHVYPPSFGALMLSGIDELLIYHYLVAEGFRYWPGDYPAFWKLPKHVQAERIWQTLFVDRSPISEAARGVVTTLHRLGLQPRQNNLATLRAHFASQKPEAWVTRCMEIAGVRALGMTNSPFDPAETPAWASGLRHDPRFIPALRIDSLVLDWPTTSQLLRGRGYDTTATLTTKTANEMRRFLSDCTKRMQPAYVMISMPPTFRYPNRSLPASIIERVLLPFCAEAGLPLALMPGVRRHVNPSLLLAGDCVGLADLESYSQLIAAHPLNKFLLTALARENQHELCVMARKFRNLHVFGCWWFTNIPSLIEEMTRMRIELLGWSVTLQHSDARVMEQLIYKWDHSRAVIGKVLVEKFCDLSNSGWAVTEQDIAEGVHAVFGGSFEEFMKS